MSLTVVVKVFCYFWCRTINSSAVQALAQDAMSDIVFNVFSMIFPICGHWFRVWWLDPIGALILSCYIILSWASTALVHINNLTGATASPEDRQVILYMIMRFADSIKYVTALNAYHAGDRLNVEVDIILADKVNQRDSHDIAEALQYAIETLPFVERAFVHLEYRRGNFTGHLN
jgi:divalent metal cation (Fe/Co/Zn/Cd) transporter